MTRTQWIIGSALLAAIVGAGGYAYWNGAQRPTVKYKTARIERGTLAQIVTATGTVNPVLTVQVGSQVSGIVTNLYADFNSEVKAGQLVARIDPAPFLTKVTEMEASLQNSRGNLARARAELAQRKLDLDRSKALFEQNLIAKADLDNARTAYETALAGIQVAEAQVRQAEALLKKAKLDLKYTEIYSPVNGIVISRNVDVGQTVAASFQTPVLFLVARDLTKMQVDTNVSESDIGGITDGKEASFVVDAYPKQPFVGRVIQVRNAPITVQNVVTYNVVIGVDNTELRLKPGMTANVSIVIDRREDILKAPNAALRFKPALARPDRGAAPATPASERLQAGQGKPPDGAARTAGGDKAKQTLWLPQSEGEPMGVEVKTGITDGNFTELIAGPVKEGDPVIVGMETSKGPHGSGAGGNLPPGFGPRPRGI
jgi:HlyD family secretion protein